MPKPAFLVEGHMEQKIIQKLCADLPVQRIGCNGKQVDMKTMARFLLPRISLLKRHSPIIIIFDKEKRKENRTKLKSDLSSILKTSGICDNFVIGISDLSIENWILAGWDGVLQKFPEFGTPKNLKPGQNGKTIVKNLLPKEQPYSETILGPQLFLAANPTTMYENDQSFREFIDSISISCHWLTLIKRG